MSFIAFREIGRVPGRYSAPRSVHMEVTGSAHHNPQKVPQNTMKSVPLSTNRSEKWDSRPENRPEMTRGSGCAGTAPQRVAAVAFLAYRTITRARQSRQADAFRLLTRMVQQNTDDLMMLCASSVAEETHKRRVVERALGAWRGSTISGYLRGDEKTYLENFRCSKQKFDAVVARRADQTARRCLFYW